ncbi:MAG: DNA repair protein RecN [Bacillota bacterium]
MLMQLNISDFALIDKLNMEFDGGFNVLTGETGAGKSIIIDAVSLLLGARALTEGVRADKEKAFITGVFYVKENEFLEKLLKEYAFDLDEDERLLTLSREISLSGKNTCRINNRIVNLGVFKEIGSQLVDIYGQHDFQSLSNKDKHIDLLDSLGDENYQNLLKTVRENYLTLKTLQKKYNELQGQIDDKSQRIGFLKFQINEIESLKLNDLNEDEEINNELAVLTNWEKIASAVNKGYEALYGNNSAYDKVSQVVNWLEEAAQFDPKIGEIAANMHTVIFSIEDAARFLKSYEENFEFNQERKEYLQERKYAIDKLKRKYGGTINDILLYLKKAAEELDELDNSEVQLEELTQKVTQCEQKYFKYAAELSQQRLKTANDFSLKIKEQLAQLAMPHTEFKVDFTNKNISPNGIDEVEFLISPNPGEPLKPLAKIASGGEMSRLMLAFKVIFAGNEMFSTLIFDEIDSGIGGHVINNIAEKLYQVSRYHQVLCVTHSPHLAAIADRHFKINKEINGNKTCTTVEILKEEERIEELARMLGGQDIITHNHASEMRNKGKNRNFQKKSI